MSIRDIFQKTSNFLFSRANRELLIFLFFFAGAGVFWLIMTLNETFEKELEVPVYYVDVPKNSVLTSPEVDTIRVTVSDKGYVIASYLFGDVLHPLPISFKSYARDGRGVVPASDLQKLIAGRMAASTKILSVKPDLTFYYNKGEKKQVAVRWRGDVSPENLYYISDVVYQPDSVTIYAAAERLDSIFYAYTEPLHYVDVRDTLTVECKLQKQKGVKIVPDKVTVSFLTDILTEESIDNIPVVGINMPEGKVLRTFPSKVKVRFVTGVKKLRNLSASDFEVVADYQELSADPSSPKCSIYLQKTPDGVSRVQLDVTTVDYLIEERSHEVPVAADNDSED